jgi:hypothetical protein
MCGKGVFSVFQAGIVWINAGARVIESQARGAVWSRAATIINKAGVKIFLWGRSSSVLASVLGPGGSKEA